MQLGTEGVPKSVQPNQISPIFWENQFFVFFGAPKNFFEPSKPYLASETSLLGGVILQKLFDLSNGSKVINFKIAIFLAKLAPDISKTVAQIKKF